jgi:ABC-2 type transport system ATP-binding protein/ribosome-dependent ATPase
MLLGILEATRGEVLLFGVPPSRRARQRVGYVPQGLGLYQDMTVAENLSFVSAAYGVDPIARARLWDTIHVQAERGAGVVVSTHYMQEAEQCDRLILLDLGRVVAQGTGGEIVGDTTTVRVYTDTWASAFEALRGADLPVALPGRQVRAVGTPPQRVRQVLVAAGVVSRVEVVPATLEEKMTAIVRARSTVGGP